jgi:hypothetical protein
MSGVRGVLLWSAKLSYVFQLGARSRGANAPDRHHVIMLWRERCAQRFAGTKPGCVVAIYQLVGYTRASIVEPEFEPEFTPVAEPAAGGK